MTSMAGTRPRRARRVSRPNNDFGLDSTNTGGIYPPFPTTPVLDTFSDGPNQVLNSPRTGWTTDKIVSGDVTMTTDSVPTYAATSSSATGSAVANVGTLTDSEAWIILETAVDTGQVWIRASNFNTASSQQGYCVGYQASTGGITISQFAPVVNGTTVVVGPMNAGDGVGISATGSMILSWYMPVGGAWQFLAAMSSSVWSSGTIAMRLGAPTGGSHVGTFGGGAANTTGTAGERVVRRVWAGR